MMKTRRMLSLVVAAILLVTTLCAVGLLNVLAAETEISDAAGLQAITGDGSYKLTQDIDLTGTNFTTIASFSGTLDGNGKTIKGISAPLFATLSGTVKNVTLEGAIASDATTAIGALANAAGGALTVTGVTNKVNVTATASASVGGFIGEVTGTNSVAFTSSTNEGAISGAGAVTGVGGFVGTVIGSAKDAHATVTVESSVNKGAITLNSTSSGYAGSAGFVGAGDKYTVNITKSLNYGALDHTSVNNGGTAGFFGTATLWEKNKDNSRDSLTVSYSANYGAITCHSNIQGPGGIAGRMNRGGNMTYTFEYCYNAGAITGGNYAGGIFAYTNNTSGTKLTVKGCYNVGENSGSSYFHAVGLSGALKPTLTQDNYYVGSVKTKTDENYPINGTSCADKDALNEKMVALGEYFVAPSLNNGYAVLNWQCAHDGETNSNCLGTSCATCGKQLSSGTGSHSFGEWTETTPATEFTNGEKTRTCTACGEVETDIIPATGSVVPVDGVYQIHSEGHLIWLANAMNTGTVAANVKIAIKTDITLTNGLPYINVKFTGTLDGEGHTVSGMNNMLFAQLGGTVKNITLNGTVNATSSKVGIVTPSAVSGAKVINVHSSASVTTTAGNLNIGGLVGYTNGGFTMEDCSFSGTVTANWTSEDAGVGGVVAWSNANGSSFTIKNCYFDGNIVVNPSSAVSSKSLFVGGVVGHAGSGGSHNVSYCTSVGKITLTAGASTYYVGGVVGRFNLDSAECYYSIFNGEIEAPKDVFVGGIVGCNTRAGAWLEKCAVLNGGYDVCGWGILADVECYTRNGVQKVGAPFTLGDTTYQRYNFGFVNAETSAMAEMTKGSSTNKVYASVRDKDAAHDLRFTLIGKVEKLNTSMVTVEIIFKKDGETVNTVEGKMTQYAAFVAGGEAYFAADGTAFYNFELTGIADGSWDTVTVSVINDTGKPIVSGRTLTYDMFVG